jgi:hypothetical protein
MRRFAIAQTYPSDWVIHTTRQEGVVTKQVGYLQDSGAERAGKIFGIEVGKPTMVHEKLDDGTYAYHFEAPAWSKVTGEQIDREFGKPDAVGAPLGKNGRRLLAPRSIGVVTDEARQAGEDAFDGLRLGGRSRREARRERVPLGRARKNAGIYQWQGQSLALILAPMIVSVAVGVVFTAWVLYRQRRLSSPLAWLAAVAGFSFIGTAASTFMQLAIDATVVNVGVEALLTFIFAVIPLILGVLTVRLALQNKPITLRHRVYLVVLGVAALFIWAGYIVGPALAIAASVMPSVLHRRRH